MLLKVILTFFLACSVLQPPPADVPVQAEESECAGARAAALLGRALGDGADVGLPQAEDTRQVAAELVGAGGARPLQIRGGQGPPGCGDHPCPRLDPRDIVRCKQQHTHRPHQITID